MNKPICEVCHDGEATSFSYLRDEGKWKFCGICTRDTEDYYIEFDRFFKSREATIDWLAHMHEKNWMDWKNFMDMMHRFRNATNAYHQLG